MAAQAERESRVQQAEQPYAFRRRLDIVHQPDRRDPEARLEEDEFIIGKGWSIVVGTSATPLILNVAKDLQDYLLTSMGESLLLERLDDVASAARDGERVIVLAARAELPEFSDGLSTPRSYRLICSPKRVVICGADDGGVGQGSYYVEDLMNLRDAPYLRVHDTTRLPLFSPRMTHSGWGLDEFPDTYLNAIAHAGMDSILVFVTGVDRSPDEHTHDRNHPSMATSGRYRDFNNLIDRAERYGLDVYFYAYFRNDDLPHPSDHAAEEIYDRTYGAVFQACPRAKGIVLVGESVEFPSKDPNTTGRHRLAPTADGLPATKPSPGWWPCSDYPKWLDLLKKVIRRHSPDADIVFWTYNWGYAPEEDRLALIRALPTDVSLLVTFEMFEPLERDGAKEVCVDYTVAFAGPGAYFSSEARVAHERGLRLYTMSNTGGLTWDFGVIPYEPVPYQWMHRHEALNDARETWGLTGLMESHHFGWWPSFISELAKSNFWSPTPAGDTVCAAFARRDFGLKGAPHALSAWRDWSEAMLDYVPTNEDQYGPFRTGPSYPLVFRVAPVFPTASHAMFGAHIIRSNYQMDLPGRAVQSTGPVRIDAEIHSFERMAERWLSGNQHLERAVALAPAQKQEAASRLLGLGRFILNSITTTIHVKQWWTRKYQLFGERDAAGAHALLDEMVAIAEREIANAEATIPLVEVDSRLGWEPSMEYVGDPAHLRWKIAQIRRVLESEIPAYRQALDVRPKEHHAASR